MSDFRTITEPELIEKYGGEWVAMKHGDIVAHSPNTRDVYVQLREADIWGAVIQFVPAATPEEGQS